MQAEWQLLMPPAPTPPVLPLLSLVVAVSISSEAISGGRFMLADSGVFRPQDARTFAPVRMRGGAGTMC